LNSDALELSDKVLAKVSRIHPGERRSNLNQKLQVGSLCCRMIASEQKYNPKLTNKDIEKFWSSALYKGTLPR
jgi:hypothetical protein